MHDDSLAGRDVVQRRAYPFIEQIGIQMIRLEVGHLQIERLALCPDRFETGTFVTNLSRQLHPGKQPAVALDQMVDEI